ncbi:MAG: hypothetical protein HYR63_24730 [Proteobacteria bacterium]|nr:hypothetical protein [Pseudomonadota bacterium]
MRDNPTRHASLPRSIQCAPVPVVTLRGSSFFARIGAGYLSQLGLHELIAETAEQYVDIAAALAKDRPRLLRLRHRLRDHLVRSPMMDGARFTRFLEIVCNAIWQRRRAALDPASLTIGIRGDIRWH